MSSTGDKANSPKPFYKKYKFWMLVFVIVYSVTTIGLWCQTKRATEASMLSAKAQIATVRAWIWPVQWQAHPIPDNYSAVQAGEWTPMTFVDMNIGHTPAINVFLMGRGRLIYHPMNSPMPFIERCPDARPKETSDFRDIQIILPGEGPTLHPRWIPSADEYDALVKGHATAILHECIYYNVVSSEELGVSEFCLEWLNASTMVICPSRLRKNSPPA